MLDGTFNNIPLNVITVYVVSWLQGPETAGILRGCIYLGHKTAIDIWYEDSNVTLYCKSQIIYI